MRGITLLEVLVALIIVAFLGALSVGTLLGLRNRNLLDRATTQVYDDLISIRSRAIATSKTHRIRWVSDTQWVLEYYDSTLSTPAWVQTGVTRYMPANTYLLSGSLTNAGSKLEATARGIFQFQNGGSGSPYITIESQGASSTKSMYVYTGGAIEIRSP